jgi:hypothetical protein
MHTRLNVDAMPPERIVMEFAFTGTHKGFSRFWLVVEDGQVDMCLKYPGLEVDLTISSDIRRFVEAWRGIRDLRSEIANGHLMVSGQEKYRRALPDWLMLSALARFPRQTGSEAHIGADPRVARTG